MKTKYKKYSKYKNSGVEWLGQIPESWEILPAKRVHNYKKEININKKCNNVLSLTLRGVVNNNPDSPEGMIPKDYGTYQIFNKDNIVFKLIDLENVRTSRVGIVHQKGIMSSAYIRLETGIKSLPKYTYYYYYNLYLNEVYNNLGSGVRSTLGPNDLLNLEFITPPLSEQTAIANFLDEKTSKIDQAIKQKQKLIALLKERKQIVIQNAVTGKFSMVNGKLLIVNEGKPIKTKHSGVEWIGEIPEHWQVKKFKYLCHITTGAKNTEDKVENGRYPFFVRSQTAEKINSYSFDGEAILTAGDGAGVGKVFHYVNCRFDFHQRVYMFSNFKNIEGKLLFFYLRNTFHNVALTGEAKSTVDSLRLPLIQNFMVTIPPLIEQKAIVSYIEKETDKIDKAINLQEQQIEKLKEYKTTLIDSAVTGKIMVNF